SILTELVAAVLSSLRRGGRGASSTIEAVASHAGSSAAVLRPLLFRLCAVRVWGEVTAPPRWRLPAVGAHFFLSSPSGGRRRSCDDVLAGFPQPKSPPVFCSSFPASLLLFHGLIQNPIFQDFTLCFLIDVDFLTARQ
ncbi:unnamed protein product, partial [Musa acuminata subsp. burmannicoides]